MNPNAGSADVANARCLMRKVTSEEVGSDMMSAPHGAMILPSLASFLSLFSSPSSAASKQTSTSQQSTTTTPTRLAAATASCCHKSSFGKGEKPPNSKCIWPNTRGSARNFSVFH